MENFTHIEPVDVSVQGLNVSVRGTSLLRDVSLHVPPGHLLAIIGGSGSGKTTLLNAMAGRVQNVETSGEILIDGKPAKEFINSGQIAYVQQEDHLLPYLTVRETLRYAARLRLPAEMPRREKEQLVEDVILELGLKECADTVIGDEWRNGISGGEKRRVSVGVQLLVNPRVLFLDEPTTGLDAFTSHVLIETLVSLCRKGRSICISIHQPRSDIFELFDRIVLLSRGDLVYSGPTSDVLPYFAKLSFPIPAQMNPADFLVDLSSVDNRDDQAEEESNTRLSKLVLAWKNRQDELAASPDASLIDGIELRKRGIDKDGASGVTQKASPVPVTRTCSSQLWRRTQFGASAWEQVRVLTERTIRNLSQDRLTLWGSVGEVLIIAIIIGYIFYKLDDTQRGILGRKSMLYITSSVQTYLGLMFMIYKLSMEMKVFDREQLDKMYGVLPYLFGWFCANFTLYAVLACLFSVILYFMAGLRTDELWHLGVFIGGNILMQFVTISWAYFCISWARDFATASLIGNAFFTFLSMSSGFFIQVNEIPVYLRWFKEISYVTYGFRLFCANEFTDNSYACPDLGSNLDDPRCNGNNILQGLGFQRADFAFPTVALVVNFLVLMTLTALTLSLKPHGGVRHAPPLRWKRKPKHGTMLDSPKHTTSAPDMEGGALATVPRVEIVLRDVRLGIQKRTLGSQRFQSFPILQGVNSTFPAGELSVILGSSGAGKSSLLNVLMGRSIQTGAFSTSVQSGSVLYSGIELTSSAQVASICSLVTQDDDHLMPALTARETLRYSALLRLPPTMPKEEKIKKADQVLIELGLKDCANRIVGGGLLKGLSGGEKRRLSIGIQLLTDPAVLVVDEPTSSLDAFTSHNLMLTLKELARSGRTVICSIHQPRSDIFHLFDRILLLARGGRTVFAGPARDMIPYFDSLGHRLPELTNPADFVLDLSSVDLRNPGAEVSSKSRVDELVRRWEARAPDTCFNNASDLGALSYRTMAPARLSLPILVSRSVVNMSRQFNLLSARVMQVVALGVIFTLYFARFDTDQSSVQGRFGMLQQQGSLIFVGMLNCIAVFPQELSNMKFESRDNAYSVGSFFFSYLLNEVPFEILSCLIYTVLAMFAAGLQVSARNFFTFFYVVFALINTGESIGIAFVALVNSVGFGVQIMSTIIALQTIMAGYLSVEMPAVLNGLNYAFLTRYVARVTAVNEFDDLEFQCSEAEMARGLCLYRTGEDALRLLDFGTGRSEFIFNMIMIAVLTLLVRVLSYIVLRVKN